MPSRVWPIQSSTYLPCKLLITRYRPHIGVCLIFRHTRKKWLSACWTSIHLSQALIQPGISKATNSISIKLTQIEKDKSNPTKISNMQDGRDDCSLAFQPQPLVPIINAFIILFKNISNQYQDQSEGSKLAYSTNSTFIIICSQLLSCCIRKSCMKCSQSYPQPDKAFYAIYYCTKQCLLKTTSMITSS